MKHEAEKLFDTYCKKPFISANRQEFRDCVELLISSFSHGGKLLICGNGGSCADADHIVGELAKSFRIPRPIDETVRRALCEQGEAGRLLAEKLQAGLPAVNLGAHSALMTAMANDVGAEYAFAQQVMAYGTESDVLLGISTSGNSKNILYAGSAARAKRMKTIGITGNSGGNMAMEFDIVLRARADSTEDIQDQHSVFYHAICAVLEAQLWGK